MSEIGPHQIAVKIQALRNDIAECEEELELLPVRIDKLKREAEALEQRLGWYPGWNLETLTPCDHPTERVVRGTVGVFGPEVEWCAACDTILRSAVDGEELAL